MTRGQRPLGPDQATIPAQPAALAREQTPGTGPVTGLPDDGDGDGATAMFRLATDPERYRRGALIGEGGMGAVHSHDDKAIGRTVAVKTVRVDRAGPDAVRRFAREARIQAQLEHPSVVPVYDVGVGADGELYFTMKRVRGHSLSQVLATPGRDGHSLRKLLTVLSSVALTVEYAHRRGVLHRDLKPSNIMLGEFGEVYVLDWGLAHVSGEPDPAGPPPRPLAQVLAAAADRPLVDSSVRPDTASGQLMGTPGYVSPELIDVGTEATGERADVYALGAILYEVVSGRRLHTGDVLGQILGSTMDLDGAHLRDVVADVAPELDQLCWSATRRDPADRLASAAAFAAGLDAYLDGDRDLAERRRLADERAGAAADVLAAGADVTAADRARAVRDVTAALGLDPGHARARATLVRLLTEPGPEAEAAAEEAGHEAAVARFRHAARNHILALATYALYVPIALWMGIRSWPLLGLMAGAIVVVMGVTAWYHRHPPRGLTMPWPHLLASIVALATGVPVLGPLVLLPAVAIATGVGYLATVDTRPPAVIAGMVAAVMVPLALQLAGVLPASYRFSDGAIAIVPGMFDLPPTPTLVFLIVTHLVVMIASFGFVWHVRQTARTAERRLRVQAWQLQQIVPGSDASDRVHDA